MARITVNLPDQIVFEDSDPRFKTAPTLSVQAGVWAEQENQETGIVFDVYGDELPLLSAHDARKLAKWLNAFAEQVDGKHAEKRHKGRRHNHNAADDEDDFTAFDR